MVIAIVILSALLLASAITNIVQAHWIKESNNGWEDAIDGWKEALTGWKAALAETDNKDNNEEDN